jgi:nucleoside 2-deoxyribosyltransferase
MPYKVYVGDSSSELEKLRPIVMDQIKTAGMIPVEMDAADRKKPDILDVAREKMKDADYFISIVTYKRGWQPDNQGGKSLAELEYDLAQALGKPSAILLPKETSEMGMYLRMRSVGQPPADTLRQHQFWQRLTQKGDAYHFSDEADLITQFAQILRRWAGDSTPSLQPPSEQEFTPSTNINVETLAEKVAQRVDAIQQKRAEDLAKQAVKLNEALRLLPGELVFGKPSTGKQFKSDIFMIMPFAASFSGIYQDIIKPLVGDLKLTITRGDEFNSTRGVIMEDVWAALNACRFVIAEISGGNDNVFYELGIAHTLNKPAILITQSKTPDEIPFDVRHLRYIRYENTAEGGVKLRDDLKAAITRLLADLEDGWGNGTAG